MRANRDLGMPTRLDAERPLRQLGLDAEAIFSSRWCRFGAETASYRQ